MIEYDFPLFRPPAEADYIIIQATLGCSHNSCTFCSMYKSKRYTVRPIEAIFKEIDLLAIAHPLAQRVFLADGDALSLNTSYLLELLGYLQKAFPRLNRVSAYATAQNLLEKSQEELSLLKEQRLTLLYFGIETGSDVLLDKIHKRVNTQELLQALQKAKNAKMKISATIILGLGGKAFSKEHIQETAKVINSAHLTYLSTLQLSLQEDVKDRFLKAFDCFEALEDSEILKEQQALIQQLDPKSPIIFRSNHASNALYLSGTLPKDKDRLLEEITQALHRGAEAFIPKRFRSF